MAEIDRMQTVALVDDDRNILTSVSIALEAEGYRVETYTDGASALDGLLARPPQLAIFDIKMPRMDGMELLRRLRQKSDMPVIFLTFAYNYASGLALYWTTQNLFSIAQLYYTRNQPLPTLEIPKPKTVKGGKKR